MLVNHLGYEADASKRAVILAHSGDKIGAFKIVDAATGKEIFSGKTEKAGPVDQWKDWIFWTADFSVVHTSGEFFLECTTDKGDVRSFPFLIETNLLEKNTLAQAAPGRGRFRSFLLASLHNFLANEWDKANAQKRGGGEQPLSLNLSEGESRLHLEPGRCDVDGRRSPHSLYDYGLVTYDAADVFRHEDSEGFVRLWGLGVQTWAAKQPRLKLYVETDNGMYDAINRGLAKARGEICGYLNCDEQYLPGTPKSDCETPHTSGCCPPLPACCPLDSPVATRSSSATLQAWAMQPHGRWGGSPSASSPS